MKRLAMTFAALTLAALPSLAWADDLDCAALYLFSARHAAPGVRDALDARWQQAIAAYQSDPPLASGAPMPVTTDEIMAEVAARQKAIFEPFQSVKSKKGKEIAARVFIEYRREITACDAGYGFRALELLRENSAS